MPPKLNDDEQSGKLPEPVHQIISGFSQAKVEFDVISRAVSKEGGIYVRIPREIAEHFDIHARDELRFRIRYYRRKKAEEED